MAAVVPKDRASVSEPVTGLGPDMMQECHLAHAPVAIEVDSERRAAAAATGLSQFGGPLFDHEQAFRIRRHVLATDERQTRQVREIERPAVHRAAENLRQSLPIEGASPLHGLYHRPQGPQLQKPDELRSGTGHA